MKAQTFLKAWLSQGQEELTSLQMFALYKKTQSQSSFADAPALSFSLLLEQLQEKGWIKAKEDKHHITPKGMSCATQAEGFSQNQLPQIQQALLSKIQAWNHLAQSPSTKSDDLPSIACVVVFGSVARSPHQDHFGDMDCAIMWRQHTASPVSASISPSEKAQALSVYASLPSNFTRWDVEDAVEEWLLSVPGVTLSSIDQLEALKSEPGFAATYLYQDEGFSLSTPQAGLRQDEQNVLQSIHAFFRDPPHAPTPANL